MANVDVTDVQSASSKMTTQPLQANSLPVTQEPPPVYTQGYINGTPNPYQYQAGPALVQQQNGQPTTMVFTSQGIVGPTPMRGTTAHVTDYTVWSVFSICCCFIFGGIALHNCSVAKTKQIVGDIQGAKKASNRALAFNVAAMACGTIIILLASLERANYISI